MLAACPPRPPVTVAVADALGLVLAAPVVAAVDVPAFPNTAMDGFAVRAVDTAGATEAGPVSLRIAGTIRAGQAPDPPVGPGEAVRIMTGAPMPPGADAVVMVERTAVAPDDPDHVRIAAVAAPGDHVRVPGDDVAGGAEVFAAGEVLGPGHLGVLAAVGVPSVLVGPRLRVGVFSTGDELVPAGQPLGPGQIHDSNRVALLSLVARTGAVPVDLGLVRDDEDAIAAAILDGAARCDALLTSGGVSMGDFDYVKVVLDRLAEMTWMQIAIRPAKPFAFGVVGRGGGATEAAGVPVFGLPGNPVSSMVSFELLARPALARMAGVPDDRVVPRPRRAVAAEPLRRRPDGKVHYVRVRLEADPDDGRLHARSAGGQGSHQLLGMARADALAVLPDGNGVGAGDPVDVLLLLD